ncbi:MAG TPA: UDP-N-acetylmuramoyl-tripeptide--D-alanyl-D-alanine ligase [Candidatus Cybelea sp.]
MAATGATLLDGDRAPALLRIGTDTRTLETGDTFLALRGEQFDGQDFTGEAVRRGAAMLVVEDAAARIAGTPTMVVERTERAYLQLARLAAEAFEGRIVAITGSTGKTTTKSFLAQLCGPKYRVAVSPANENNEIGVGKLMLSLSDEEHDLAIVEMGARHAGDIAVLVETALPQVGILTNVGDAHVEIMGSRERLAETKWALFSGGARAVLNANDDVSRERAPGLREPRSNCWFVALSSRGRLAGYEQFEHLAAVVGNDRLVVREGGKTNEYAIATTLPGLYNRFNLAAAIAGALALDVPAERLISEIPALQLPQGRYHRLEIEGGPRVIFDAYNANASGMIAVLDAFANESAPRKIAVLASMAELGEEAQTLHERVGERAATAVDVLLVSGDFAAALARGARRAGLEASRIVSIEDNSHAAAWLRANASGEDLVLLKGSRKYKMEEIVEELRA